MDVLKLLSRGTKPTARTKTDSLAQSSHHPSSTSTNPQLYHDKVGNCQGLKRKWSQDLSDASLSDDDTSDIDFFAPGKTESKKLRPEKQQRTQQHKTPDSEPPKDSTSIDTTTKLLDRDECRSTFLSHRLKIIIVPHRKNKEPPEKVSKKKKKKQKPDESSKTDKKPIYPQPLNSFPGLRNLYNISRRLAGNLHKQAYKIPTEVQLGSLPLLLDPKTALSKWVEGGADDTLADRVTNGVDFLAVAPTGSGKTITFLIPVMNAILKRRSQEEHNQGDHGLEAIIVAPTRELATQITLEGRKLASGTGIRVVGMKKGMRVAGFEGGDDEETKEDESHGSSSEEEEEHGEADNNNGVPVKSRAITKADILITTPMMLINFLKGGKTLPTVQQLILDEADVLLDPLFVEQTMDIWSACTHPSLRLSCWSATMSSTVEDLITDKIASRVECLDPQPVQAPLFRLVVGMRDTAVPNISHKLTYAATEEGKRLGLRQLLRPNPGAETADAKSKLEFPFIVFTQNIERATALYNEFKYDLPLALDGGSRIAVLHSALSETTRSGIMTRFRAGDVWVLVSTDLLMRGIDFPGLRGVVNYDIPQSAASYVHRAGRTGRAGRAGGIAVTFYTKEDIPYMKTIANVISMSEKQAGKEGDEAEVKDWLLGVLPDVKKEDRKELKTRGVLERRKVDGGGRKSITSKSGWERRRENNRRGAIEGSKRRKEKEARLAEEGGGAGEESEWRGLDD